MGWKSKTVLDNAQSEDICETEHLREYTDFQSPRILPWSKLLSGSKLGSKTQKQLLLHIQSPSFVLPTIRVNQYPSLHLEATRHSFPPVQGPGYAANFSTLSRTCHVWTGSSARALRRWQMRNAKALWRNAPCVDGKWKVWGTRGVASRPGTSGGVERMGKISSFDRVGRNYSAQKGRLATGRRSLILGYDAKISRCGDGWR